MKRLTTKVGFWALLLLFLLFVLVGFDDVELRAYLFRTTLLETEHALALYKFLYDFGVGGLVSLLFYVLLVHLPDRA